MCFSNNIETNPSVMSGLIEINYTKDFFSLYKRSCVLNFEKTTLSNISKNKAFQNNQR